MNNKSFTWKLCFWITLAIIWYNVLFISIFAPDLITGTDQSHLPVARFFTWFWGMVASGGWLISMDKLRKKNEDTFLWIGYAIVVSLFWTAAAQISVFVPDLVTGTDPTHVPIGAIFAPF